MKDRNGDKVENGLLRQGTIELNDNILRKKPKENITYYDIMHGEKKVAEINTKGEAFVLDEKFLPYDLYLEEDHDFDTLINNINNFYHWCASRILTLDREYAKEILNSIGATQSATDKERAQIALSYHCLSLIDIFWAKEKNEQQNFSELNLFENHLNIPVY